MSESTLHNSRLVSWLQMICHKGIPEGIQRNMTIKLYVMCIKNLIMEWHAKKSRVSEKHSYWYTKIWGGELHSIYIWIFLPIYYVGPQWQTYRICIHLIWRVWEMRRAWKLRWDMLTLTDNIKCDQVKWHGSTNQQGDIATTVRQCLAP